MNSIFVLILGLVVFFIGYRVYAKHIDAKVIQADPMRATPAKQRMDGAEFMPTGKSLLFGYQFTSIAGVGPILGPIVALQWGWLPALLWILVGALFIGWVQDYSSAMMAVRKEGATLGELSGKLISPRARIVLLCFIYFFLLLLAGAFGNIVVDAAIAQKTSPMAWLFLTIGGLLAGQMIFRWRKGVIHSTVVCVLIALFGIWLGTVAPSDKMLGAFLSSYRPFWAIAVLLFCYVAAVLPIWRFALPINYVASYVVLLGLLFGMIGVLVLHPDFTLPAYTEFEIEIGHLWPILFVTIGCGAVSGWHGIVSNYGTGRQLENEMDVRPVCGGAMFVEMMLALFALILAGTIYASSADYEAGLAKGPIGVFAGGVSKFLGALGMPYPLGKSYGGVMLIILAITVLHMVIRFMKVTMSELLGELSPLFRNAHVGTTIAIALTLILILTGWWRYLWLLFGESNQLMASLALMLATAFLMSEGKSYAWTFYPMIFMFLTTTAALVVTSCKRFKAVFSGPVDGGGYAGKLLMGLLALFMVAGAILLAIEGIKAFRRYRSVPKETKGASVRG
jgi:carbon starvation protein